MDLAELRLRVAKGERFAFLYFWGHTPARNGKLGPTCLSNWYAAPFELGAQRYATTEHFMMAEKARLFGDDEMRARIVVAKSPADAKRLGRQVRGFDEERWVTARFDVVVRGNEAKFRAHAPLRDFLLATGDRVLVEASPRDPIWGIGLGADDPRTRRPDAWRGLNLLGFALGEVRARLRVG